MARFQNRRDNGQRILREAARVLPGIRGVAVERVTVGHRVMPVDEYPDRWVL